jgi:hypothetical protein
MLKVVIVTDGPYGDRAFETINELFDTAFIEMVKPEAMFIEEIEIPERDLKIIKSANILITYTTHPDVTLILVEKFHDKVDWMAIASWKGDGFKNQLESHGNVTCPYIMCELVENGNSSWDEFVSKIGKPKVVLEYYDDKISDITVLRSSPCGSTAFVAGYLKEKYLGKTPDIIEFPLEAGLKLQHYPCRAAKVRLFSDEECKKEMASGFHRDAFEEATKSNDLKL